MWYNDNPSPKETIQCDSDHDRDFTVLTDADSGIDFYLTIHCFHTYD